MSCAQIGVHMEPARPLKDVHGDFQETLNQDPNRTLEAREKGKQKAAIQVKRLS